MLHLEKKEVKENWKLFKRGVKGNQTKPWQNGLERGEEGSKQQIKLQTATPLLVSFKKCWHFFLKEAVLRQLMLRCDD